ncbi:hypothetical protein DEO72_LG9g1474 [Vigna unguiculata]|uniref:Uncharacterized protein n=1 Tax=Vigna unguiculata TaxID=3917 RepID=A0A4D6N0I2_VIGUN|nr:hypothetical protein DEO72_LG9g1474 [Vigna unguiculata]
MHQPTPQPPHSAAATTTSDHRSSRQNAATRRAPPRLQPPRRARAGTPPPSRSNISNLPLPRRRDSSRCVFFLVPPSHLHLLQLSGLHRATIAPPSLHHHSSENPPFAAPLTACNNHHASLQFASSPRATTVAISSLTTAPSSLAHRTTTATPRQPALDNTITTSLQLVGVRERHLLRASRCLNHHS